MGFITLNDLRQGLGQATSQWSAGRNNSYGMGEPWNGRPERGTWNHGGNMGQLPGFGMGQLPGFGMGQLPGFGMGQLPGFGMGEPWNGRPERGTWNHGGNMGQVSQWSGRNNAFGMGQANQWGMGQVCVAALPTTPSATEAASRFAALTEDQRNAQRAPQVAQLKAAGVTGTDAQLNAAADQRILADLTTQIDRERAGMRICPPSGELVRQSVDAVVGPYGADQKTTYTIDRLNAIAADAQRRGVLPTEVVNLVRQEVWRRLLLSDPNPQGDLNELAARLGAYAYPAPPAAYPPSAYAQPPAPYPPQPAPYYQDPLQAQQNMAPSVAQTPPPAARPRRERSAPRETPLWKNPLVMVAGGVLATLAIVNFAKK